MKTVPRVRLAAMTVPSLGSSLRASSLRIFSLIARVFQACSARSRRRFSLSNFCFSWLRSVSRPSIFCCAVSIGVDLGLEIGLPALVALELLVEVLVVVLHHLDAEREDVGQAVEHPADGDRLRREGDAVESDLGLLPLGRDDDVGRRLDLEVLGVQEDLAAGLHVRDTLVEIVAHGLLDLVGLRRHLVLGPQVRCLHSEHVDESVVAVLEGDGPIVRCDPGLHRLGGGLLVLVRFTLGDEPESDCDHEQDAFPHTHGVSSCPTRRPQAPVTLPNSFFVGGPRRKPYPSRLHAVNRPSRRAS
jgi:hypothetical protein